MKEKGENTNRANLIGCKTRVLECGQKREGGIQRHCNVMYHSANSNGKSETEMMVHSYIWKVFERQPFSSLIEQKKRYHGFPFFLLVLLSYITFQEAVTCLISRKQMEKLALAHLSVKCHSVMFTTKGDKSILIRYGMTLFQVVSLSYHVCCAGIYIYGSKHVEWQSSAVFQATERGSATAYIQRKFISHGCRFSPPRLSPFLHDRGSAKVWNIDEGLQDGAPFQGPPIMTPNQSILLGAE